MRPGYGRSCSRRCCMRQVLLCSSALYQSKSLLSARCIASIRLESASCSRDVSNRSYCRISCGRTRGYSRMGACVFSHVSYALSAGETKTKTISRVGRIRLRHSSSIIYLTSDHLLNLSSLGNGYIGNVQASSSGLRYSPIEPHSES